MTSSVSLAQLMRLLDEFAPFSAASAWDNSGLQIGDFARPITGILFCVDCTEAVVKEAAEKGCECIVSHHPLLFRPLKQVVEQFGAQRVVRQLIRENIALISTHTNLDYAEYGLCHAMAQKLALYDVQPVLQPGEEDAGYGRWGKIEPMPLSALAQKAKQAFSAGCVKYAGDGARPIRTVLAASGSGLKAVVHFAMQQGIDCIVTSDVAYNDALDAVAAGLCVIDAGHFDTEKSCCEIWTQTLQSRLNELKCNVRLYTAHAGKDVFHQV